ncbi:Hypothetical predicted protein [Octopus vulgaris]|uniref:Uncharacterized protein n=1 Tax=Octopus vulgaris TaxID=6645 RepID=A0AA36B403_OCTVU|nr:Hypothetical predicted protein [Octopus vulgaris]
MRVDRCGVGCGVVDCHGVGSGYVGNCTVAAGKGLYICCVSSSRSGDVTNGSVGSSDIFLRVVVLIVPCTF